MSELKAGKIELLELDLDIRLIDLMSKMADLAIVSAPDTKELIVASHRRGVENVMSDENPEQLYTEHGYAIPPTIEKPVPLPWHKDGYSPSDEEIIGHYEQIWNLAIGDSDLAIAATYMRAAYGYAHTFTYLKLRNSL